MTPSEFARFEDSYIPEPNSGCWLWLRSTAPGAEDYAKIYVGGRLISAHRAIYSHARGPIPTGLYVCHKCDVRCCVNPDHLWLGTARDNTHDMIRKGRGLVDQARPGEKNGRATLTEDDVREIRRSPLASSRLASVYGLHSATIRKIRRRLLWKVAGPAPLPLFKDR